MKKAVQQTARAVVITNAGVWDKLCRPIDNDIQNH